MTLEEMQKALGEELTEVKFQQVCKVYESLGWDIDKQFKEYADFKFCKLLNAMIENHAEIHDAKWSHEVALLRILHITDKLYRKGDVANANSIETEIAHTLGRDATVKFKLTSSPMLFLSETDKAYVVMNLK